MAFESVSLLQNTLYEILNKLIKRNEDYKYKHRCTHINMWICPHLLMLKYNRKKTWLRWGWGGVGAGMGC